MNFNVICCSNHTKHEFKPLEIQLVNIFFMKGNNFC